MYSKIENILCEAWKIPHLVTGTMTWIPALNTYRRRRASTGGSGSYRYCYSVWLRHLVSLHNYGFRIRNARVGELGPGDSIGIGLAALLSGALSYVGLDIVPFSQKANLESILNDLLHLYRSKEPIPNNDELPFVRPTLVSYKFPQDVVDSTELLARAEKIRTDIKAGLNHSRLIKYEAPWNSPDVVAADSLDLIFSQAVLEHVDDLEITYRGMSAWLKPGAFASHVIDFGSHHLSPFWNGHWAYSDWQWKLARGRREFLLNREPLSTHLRCAKEAGFQVLNIEVRAGDHGLDQKHLVERFQRLDQKDRRTQGVFLTLRKI